MHRAILQGAFFGIFFGWTLAFANSAAPGDYLVKLKSGRDAVSLMSLSNQNGGQVQDLKIGGWVRVQLPAVQTGSVSLRTLQAHPAVEYAHPNYVISLKNTFLGLSAAEKAAMLSEGMRGPSPTADWFKPVPPDNPALPPASISGGSGADPLFSNQWGMRDAGVESAWKETKGREDIVVAVLDTGVDYTHEDLAQNIWRNPGESGRDAQGRDKSSNGVDDDGNGYVDDLVGWDFVSKDNKPYDLTTSVLDMLMGGGNPGHGTHCAGNIGARSSNGKGIAGVAPNIKIMALRFLSEKGQGTTADAILAIQYAIRNGARITSNSWGSEGEDPGEDNKALRDAIAASQSAGVLFVAAAGNGHNGAGYDNDNDAKPGYPASYPDDIIVSVAALDVNGALGSFSNWGRTSVDIGAPGVKVFSTVPGNGYQDTVIEGMATWDGTSMATPHVAGAAALYWSKYPNKSWLEVKNALLQSVKSTSSMTGKSTTGGRLDVFNLLTKF